MQYTSAKLAEKYRFQNRNTQSNEISITGEIKINLS